MDAIPDIVDLVLGFLVMLSLLIWTIGIAKCISFYRHQQHNRHFMDRFQDVAHVQDLGVVLNSTQGSLSRICQSGVEEMKSMQRIPVALATQEKRDILLHALNRQAMAERERMESGLGILASVGSTAPFIGLFGTVWGIMHALKSISATGSAGLDVVAGPIGEALIATAIGIATAVPAVLAYNYFLRRVKLFSGGMGEMAEAFHILAVKSGMKGD